MKLATPALILALSVPLVAQQDDRARTEALARRATDRLQALHQEADRLASEARSLLGALRRLDLERQIRDEELRQVRADSETAAADLDALNQELQRLERQEAAERPQVNARLVELYKLGQGRYLRLLLSTSSVRQVGQASRMVAALAKRDRERLAAHQRRSEELKESRVTLQERSSRLAALRASAEIAQAASVGAVNDRNALIRKIDERRDLNAQLAGELLGARQKLQATLRSLAAGAAVEPATLPLNPFRGDLDWPVAGVVRRPFGQLPSSTRSGLAAAQPSSPNGIEIAAGEGTSVVAIHDGTIAFADVFAGYGKLIIVDHGAQAFSLYGHLLDFGVARGNRIERGAAVGSVGTSLAGAPGLYFEVRVDGRPVDPLQWLKKSIPYNG